MNYLLEALDILHEKLRPSSYVEIGCREGASLSRCKCPAVAIDPNFAIRFPLLAPTRIFRETSDRFFAQRDLTSLLGSAFDFGFIDGMHKCEYALRDFVNLERHAHAGSVIVLDDVLPQDMSWTTRERKTAAWTGDVYKVIPLLRQVRPDLQIDVFDINMKGMAVISNLDHDNDSLRDRLPGLQDILLSKCSDLDSVETIRAKLKPRPVDEFEPYVAGLAASRKARRPCPNRPGAQN